MGVGFLVVGLEVVVGLMIGLFVILRVGSEVVATGGDCGGG